MRKLWLVFVVVSVGCASHKPNAAALAAAEARAIQAQIDQADARILEGCYECLLEARDRFLNLAGTKTRPTILARLFEVQLLIALRQKELALDPAVAIAAARDLVKELPPAMESERYLGLVDAVSPEDNGTPRAELRAFRLTPARGKYAANLDEELKWLASSTGVSAPVRQYISLAFDCTTPRPRRPGQLPGEAINRDPGPSAPPLVRFRYAICGDIRRAPLEEIRAAVPRFVETSYFIARLDVAAKRSKARESLIEALTRFPQSPAVTYLNATFNQLIGDCRAGLRFYDETVAIKPRHENSLLGRVVCLTFLKRGDEAVAAATHVIDLKLDNVADALYWRAWNYHELTQLDAARTDVESAKRLSVKGEILTLAGIIEYEQNDFPTAERDLTTARSLSGGERNCVASWYLGLVEMKREHWPESAAHFEGSMGCYQASVAEDQANKRAMEANQDVDPEFKAKQIAGFDAAIEEDSKQMYASAFNAANHFARGGNQTKARVLVEIAAKDPSLADRVADLKKILAGGGLY